MELSQIEISGWIGSICLAICAIPQAYKSFKEKHSNGVSWSFIVLWLVGEICTLIYIIPTGSKPLIFNYVANILFVAVIFFYKFRKP